ncbi:uncharacterized protein itprid1 [Trachinotus anak]|uniref:uncharacterized protein itprid1 n=1 Tax=Trachinotus anak TaxID=443729 RepID=UPI0039F18740
MSCTGGRSQNRVRTWLNSTVTEEDAKHQLREASGTTNGNPPVLIAEVFVSSSLCRLLSSSVVHDEPARRNASSDDDLVLGVEASLYGKQPVRTVQEFLWWSRSSSALSRWNSFSSTTSGHCGPLSVMDVLNLWNDDPEEVLLDLGFGCDEPDLSGRIPARFINYQSQARGINLQVFLEAQKNRLDLENPDVSNRFRQLEVLQQVTTAFSSLVGSSSSSSSTLKAPLGKDLDPEAKERRRRMGMLFRRASKKSLSQIHNQKTQDLTTPTPISSACAIPESLQPLPSLGDRKVPSKRPKPGLLETVGLSPLAEEQGAGADPQPQHHVTSHIGQEGALRSGSLKEGHPLTATTFSQRKRSPGPTSESFEMEEIHSFDDSSVTGSYTGGAGNLVRGVIRTNSCQSDSSGFLEEPFILSLPQQPSPGHDLIKALSGLSGGSTDSQGSERPGSPCFSFPQNSSSHLLSSSLISSGVDKCLPSSLCPSPEPSLFGPTPSLCLPKDDPQSSEMEAPSLQDQSPPAVLSELVFEHLPPRSSSPELENVTESQCPTLPSPAIASLSPTSSPMQAVSLARGSEDTETEDKDTLCPHLSTLPPDTKETACSTFSCVPPCPSPILKLDCSFSDSIAVSSTQFDSSPGSPGNSQSDWTEVALHPSAPPDFNCPSSFVSPPLIESTSQTPENNQKDSVVPDSGGVGLSETPTNTQKEPDKTPSSLSFQLDKNNPSALTPYVQESCKLEEGCPTLPCLSPSPSIPVCQSQSHDPGGLVDPAADRISERSISLQDHLCSHDDNTDPPPTSPVQDVSHVKMDHLYLDIKGDLKRNRKGEGERHSETVQTGDTVVYVSETESSAALSDGFRVASQEVCNQAEREPLVPSCSLYDELSAETNQEELREVCQMETNGTESESTRSYLVSHEVAEVHSRPEVEPKDLIKIESLDLVFETSVDCSEGENGDVEAFFQQLDTEGQVYWAEPIQVSTPTHVFKESGSFEASDGSPGNSLMSTGSVALDSISSTDKAMSLSPSATMGTDQNSASALPTTQDLKPSSRSVSVQMSSSLSSHIVHRKDVPYRADSKCTRLPGVLPLDTSTPFRAVQTWTDMQIQRNTLMKKLSHEALHTVPNEVTISMRASETSQRPTLIYSSSPSFPLLSSDWQTNEHLPGITKNYQNVSISMDTGLCPDEEEEVDRNIHEDEEKLWEGNQPATMVCCCSCDHQCTCCAQKGYNKQHTLGNMPYSLGDLEEMMLCLQKFRSVLSNMEEQLSEDQASIYIALSEQDRERVRDIEELREAVKQEAGELEMQLNELAHYYDDSLKMKMDRLLDEQSLLCSQLRVFLPGTVPTSSSPTPNRTVATQCCLLPWIAPADLQSDHVSSWSTWNVDSPRQSPPGSESICKGMGCSPTKADKLDIKGFLQKVRTSHYDLWENK